VVTAARLRADIERLKALRGAGRVVVLEDRARFATAVGLPDLDPWQLRLLRSEAPRVLLNCSRQSGKSTMAGVVALHRALLVPDSLVLILAPSERQAKELFTKVGEGYRTLGPPYRPTPTASSGRSSPTAPAQRRSPARRRPYAALAGRHC
jgi:hypothetical protein